MIIRVIRRSGIPSISQSDLGYDIDKLEVVAINVLHDIEIARQRLALQPDDVSERSTLLGLATAAVQSARRILKSARNTPTEAALAEARSWMAQAREAMTKVPGLEFDAY